MIFIWAATFDQARLTAFNSKLDRTQWRHLNHPYQLRSWRGSRVLVTETYHKGALGKEIWDMIEDRQCRITHVQITQGFKLEAIKDT